MIYASISPMRCRWNKVIKVLIVDDDEIMLNVYEQIFSKEKRYDIRITTNPDEVVILACEQKPDIILLDVMMPYKDGGEVAAELRSNPKTALIPVIFLTGILSKQEAQRRQPEHYLSKPVDPKELLTMINQLVS